MQRTRVKDWLVGAVGMLVLLLVAATAGWWILSDPADPGAAGAPPSAPGSPGPARAEAPAGLGEDEVWFADLELDAGTLVASGSVLRDVRAVGHDVLTRPQGLVASRATVEATVPFEVVADELGPGTVVGPADEGQAMVVRDVEVLGRELRVVATGTVEVVGGRLVVEPRSIDLGGPDFVADALAAVVRRLVTIEHDIEGLPEGMLLHDVDVRRDGFRAHLRGEDVSLLR